MVAVTGAESESVYLRMLPEPSVTVPAPSSMAGVITYSVPLEEPAGVSVICARGTETCTRR